MKVDLTSGSARVRELLGEPALERLHADVAGGSGLPNLAYISAEWHDLERRHLMFPLWMLAGFESQIPDIGDALPVTVAGCPIVLLRQHDGGIRAFHNVCRHRGAVIVTEPCRGLAALTCPYHAWAYGLDGTIRTRPHFHGGGQHDVTKKNNGRANLVEVRCDTWRGVLFVNIDGNAPSLADHMAPIDNHLDGWAPQPLAYGGSLTYDIAANWKHVHENFVDVYHKFAIHPELCAFAPLENSNPMVPIADHILKTWHLIAEPHEGRGKGLPFLPGLPDVLHREGRMFTMIPTCDINLWPDHIAFLVAEPTGPGTARETIHILFSEEAMSGQFDDARQKVMDTWDALNRQDIAPLESMQRGRASPGFDGGSLSPFWDSGTQYFACQIASLMVGTKA